jgi:hypothetical protein
VAKPGPFPLEEVSFSPTISYVALESGSMLTAGGIEPRDPSNAPLYRFDAFEDFRLAGTPLSAVTVPVDGTIQIDSIIEKTPCSDDVHVCIQKFGGDEEVEDVRATTWTIPRRFRQTTARGRSSRRETEEPACQPHEIRFPSPFKTFGGRCWSSGSADLSTTLTVDWNISGGMTSVCVEEGGGCVMTPSESRRLFVRRGRAMPLPSGKPSRTEASSFPRGPATPVLPFIATGPQLHGYRWLP